MKSFLTFCFFIFFSISNLFGQASSGKTFDTEIIEFEKAPILKWRSDEQLNDKPLWEGFVLVKAKLNGRYDIKGGLQEEETFNVGQIDVWGSDDRKNFAMDMHQTQLRIWSKRKTATGDFVGYLEGDFWGGDGHFRLRTAWFDYKFLHVGQDWSFFGDKQIWPNVLDWDGPPSGVWRRAPQIKFYFKNENKWHYEIGIENPGSEFRFNEEIDANISDTYPTMPDFIGAIKKEFWTGYMRLSAIYRNLNYEINGTNQVEHGYGASLSAIFKPFEGKNDLIQFQLVGGRGISSYLASFGGRNYDGIPTGNGEVSLVPAVGAWVSYEYWFNDQWHSNIVLGYSDFVTDDISSMTIGPGDISATNTKVALDHNYIVINLMYNPTPGLSLGIEYNLGNRQMAYEGDISTPEGNLSSIEKSRNAQRIGFGAFFDF
ncbi:MAG: hypothetical protein OCD76_07145 [Reichenbachiella sp.]